MAVPTTITDLSTTANSNSPAGTEVPSSGNGPDEYIRALGSIARVLRAKGSDVASATTTDLGAATTGDFVHVTGTTTITGLGTIAAGIKKVVTFDGALTLTHNGTSLILPGAANITTATNDIAVFVSEGAGNWRCISYFPYAGYPALSGANTWTGVQSFTQHLTITGAGKGVIFEGTTADDYETTLLAGEPTADRTVTLPNETCDLGFRNIPQNSQSAAYTTVLADSGKHIYHPAADTTARTWTIDSNANVAYPIGTAITFDNDYGAGALTIAITSDTMVLVGSAGSTGSRTLASGGQATAIKVTATRWRIGGTSLT